MIEETKTTLTSKESIENALGVDLASELGQTDNNTTYVSNWIAQREREIITLIKTYSFHDLFVVPVDEKLEEFQQAVIFQCEYKLRNAIQSNLAGISMYASGFNKLTRQERMEANISPMAHETLCNAGFLYTGGF